MSWLYLAVSLYGAWFTWNLYRPRYGGPRLATWSFFAGWLTGELALLHIVWQAASTLGFAALGAMQAWPGRMGLAVTLASWMGLAWHHRSVARSLTVMETALRDGLGEGWEQVIVDAWRRGGSRPAAWKSVVGPHRLRRPEVVRVRDVSYARVGGLNLKLDVYHRRDRPAGAPVLLQIHGGAWIVGSKNEQGLPLMYDLAALGWVCVSADYRLSPHATFPDHLIDLKRAIAWIRANIARYGGDPEFLAVTGGSAGGHLAALVGLTANDPEYQPGFEQVDTSVAACVPFYGVYDFTDRDHLWPNRGLAELLERRVLKGSLEEKRAEYEKASPRSRVRADAPPFFVIHGDRDTLVPVAEARAFARELRALSRSPVLYAELPGAQHAFEIFRSLRTQHAIDGVERFLAYVYSGYLTRRQQDAEAPRSIAPHVVDGGAAATHAAA